MSGEQPNRTFAPSRQQVVRKRSLRRAIRLICLRGHVHYRGKYYDATNHSELLSTDDFREEVTRLFLQDSSITAPLL